MNFFVDSNAWELVQARSWAFADAAIYSLACFAVAGVSRWGKRPILPSLSLRTRTTIALVLMSALALVSVAAGMQPMLAVVIWALVLLIAIHSILSNLSAVGILNAFATTTSGLTPEDSLRLVKREMTLLGIGGSKLTDSGEFAKALKRCSEAGGKVRFLLSAPDNPSLQRLAKQNQRDDASYRSRVRESIREIITQATIANVPCEVRIYRLETKLELPHFRLMFIDNETCLFSHLVWNNAEGWDNPQLILRRNTKNKPNALYLGYQQYFDDLWTSTSVQIVTKDLLATWPS